MLKNQKGITLVALVVTIVVLIILATISISVALNGGIIGHAENARDHQANADAQWEEFEQTVLDHIDAQLENAGIS